MIFDDWALLIDPESTNYDDRQIKVFIFLSKINPSRFAVLNLVAHELAHQWFGNIVTLDWWVVQASEP